MSEVNYAVWPAERLRRLQLRYRDLRDEALLATGDRRRFMLGVLRRARKRLGRIGLRVMDRQPRELHFRPRRLLSKQHGDDGHLARQMAQYILEQGITYGTGKAVAPSWSLALHTFELSDELSRTLDCALADAVGEYAAFCRKELGAALGTSSDPNPHPVLWGVPEPVRQLWRDELSRRNDLPICFRPDLVVTHSGDVQVIEFNVDTRLDRGVAEGVSQYSGPLLRDGSRLAGKGLIPSTIDLAQAMGAGRRPILCATVTSPSWRSEYWAEERFFCRSVSKSGSVDWCHRTFEDIGFSEDGRFAIDRQRGLPLDLLRLEMDVLNQPHEVRAEELTFMQRVLRLTGTRPFSTTLPFADKYLLAAAWDSPGISDNLRQHLCPTWMLTPGVQDRVEAGRRDGQHFVLKRCGLFSDTTGSKGVVISSDVSDAEWQQAMGEALEETLARHACWIMQPRLAPRKYSVKYRHSPNALTRGARCFVRLSAFFTPLPMDFRSRSASARYELAGAITTAGTDEATMKRQLHCIRGLRQSTYMAVTTSAPPAWQSLGLSLALGGAG